jgi:hypothetical protein
MALAAPPGSARLAQLVGHDTEAGRMMARLYGRPKDPTPLPKPRAGSAPWQPAANFRAVLPAPGAVDPTVPRINRAAIAELEAALPPPTSVNDTPPPAAIDTIPSRRSAAQISASEAAAAAAADTVLPPVTRGYNNPDAEKRRLQATFTYKGGKALPAAGLAAPLEGHIPLAALAAPAERMAKQRAAAAAAAAAAIDETTPAGVVRSLEARRLEVQVGPWGGGGVEPRACTRVEYSALPSLPHRRRSRSAPPSSRRCGCVSRLWGLQ